VTHVLHHQGGVIHRQAADTPAPPATAPSGTYYKGKEGAVDIDPEQVAEVPEVPYANAKLKLSGVDVRAKFKAGTRTVRRETGDGSPTKQREKWWDNINRSETETIITRLIKGDTAKLPVPNQTPAADQSAVHLLRFGAAGSTTETKGIRAEGATTAGGRTARPLNGVIVGTKDELINTALLPYWDRNRTFNPMNVDHLVESQLGGEDEFNNYWLWEAVANQSAGIILFREINKKIKLLFTAARKAHKDDPGKPVVPKGRGNRNRYQWQFKVGELGGNLSGLNGSPNVYWTAAEVSSGEPAKLLSKVTTAEAQALGLDHSGSKGHLTIIVGGESGGGALVRLPWKKDQRRASGTDVNNAFKELYPHFTATEIDFDKTKKELHGTVDVKGRQWEIKPLTLKLDEFPGEKDDDPLFAKLSEQNLAKQVGPINFKKLSPITLTEAEMAPYAGFGARGVLQPSIPILRNSPIDVVFEGGDIFFAKTFDAKNLPLPAPLKVTSGGITVSAGTNGFQVGGSLSVALGTLANGSLSASVDAKQNFAIDGQLDFDKTLFQPASLGFSYRKAGSDYSWGINGTLGIPSNKVPGIKKALVQASYTNNKFAIDGNADLSIPGLQSGSLAITYADQTGLTIGGTLAFAPNAFIESGSLDATVTKQPPNHWSVAAHGTVKPKIPGINTTLNASYNDGIYTIEGTVAYARGMLAGSLTVGLTNQPLGADGQPDAGPPKAGSPKGGGAPQASGPLRPYGSGTLTARITPWLQGTAGVQIQKDGSVQLMGEIKLPDSIDLFKAIEVQKNILNVGVKIPIVGVSVLGQSIGIFADVSGGLDASAGVGPGQLNQLGLKVQYNPEHEDQTQITGTAHLDIPAHAGLRLYVNGGIGAGIPVVSAEAGLQITGQLGLQSVVQAGVTVNWTPKKGLVIDAQASLTASPTFTFDINGYVKVTADLLFDTITLYDKQWNLASVQYGSGLQIGVSAPIHYEEGKPFSFSPSDVKFQLPKIDPTSILTDLVHKVV
jgi:hypothetical protein